MKGFSAFTTVSSGTALKTLLQLLSPANRYIRILEVSLFGDGTSSTGVPGLWELDQQGDAGTMTALVADTDLNKVNANSSGALTLTGSRDATVEPAKTRTLALGRFHPQSGVIWHPPTELTIPANGRLGLCVTFAASINVTAQIIGEEA